MRNKIFNSKIVFLIYAALFFVGRIDASLNVASQPIHYIFTVGGEQVEFIDDKPLDEKHAPAWVKNLNEEEVRQIIKQKCFPLIAYIGCYLNLLFFCDFSSWNNETRESFLKWLDEFAKKDVAVGYLKSKIVKSTESYSDNDWIKGCNLYFFEQYPEILYNPFYVGVYCIAQTFNVAFRHGEGNLVLKILNKLTNEQREECFKQIEKVELGNNSFSKNIRSAYNKKYSLGGIEEAATIGESSYDDGIGGQKIGNSDPKIKKFISSLEKGDQISLVEGLFKVKRFESAIVLGLNYCCFSAGHYGAALSNLSTSELLEISRFINTLDKPEEFNEIKIGILFCSDKIRLILDKKNEDNNKFEWWSFDLNKDNALSKKYPFVFGIYGFDIKILSKIIDAANYLTISESTKEKYFYTFFHAFYGEDEKKMKLAHKVIKAMPKILFRCIFDSLKCSSDDDQYRLAAYAKMCVIRGSVDKNDFNYAISILNNKKHESCKKFVADNIKK